jgi:cell division transport system ATP-binding protein
MRASHIPELRRKIGIVFQDFKLLNDRTVFENVAVALEVIGQPRPVVQQKVWRVLKSVGLAHKMHAHPLLLSGGEQQRVAIARAIVNEPDILLADEPTGNLDPDLTLEIMKLLQQVNARGTTVSSRPDLAPAAVLSSRSSGPGPRRGRPLATPGPGMHRIVYFRNALQGVRATRR